MLNAVVPSASTNFKKPFEQQYLKGQHLGSGHYGDVYQVVEKATKGIFACKEIPEHDPKRPLDRKAARLVRHLRFSLCIRAFLHLASCLSSAALRDRTAAALQEIHALQLLGQHLNIVAQHAVVEDNDKVYLIVQLWCGGELFGHILSQGTLSERQARGYFVSMLTAVDACHTQGAAVTLIAAFGPLVVRN